MFVQDFSQELREYDLFPPVDMTPQARSHLELCEPENPSDPRMQSVPYLRGIKRPLRSWAASPQSVYKHDS